MKNVRALKAKWSVKTTYSNTMRNLSVVFLPTSIIWPWGEPSSLVLGSLTKSKCLALRFSMLWASESSLGFDTANSGADSCVKLIGACLKYDRTDLIASTTNDTSNVTNGTTTQQTGSSGGDKTGLLTGNSASRYSGSLTNVAMVTTTMRMVDWVHGHTSGLGPRVTLDSVLVESSTGLQQWLVDSSSTGNNTNDTSGVGADDLLGSRCTSVTDLLLDVGHNGTFWHGAQRQNVTNIQRCLLTGVDKLAGVNTFVGDEGLHSQLVLVWVSESHLGQRSTSAGVVDDAFDNTTDVTVSFGIVQRSQLGSTLSAFGVGRENGTSTFSLVTNYSTHAGVASSSLGTAASTAISMIMFAPLISLPLNSSMAFNCDSSSANLTNAIPLLKIGAPLAVCLLKMW